GWTPESNRPRDLHRRPEYPGHRLWRAGNERIAKGRIASIDTKAAERLSEAGNQVWKRVGMLLDVLGRMEVWLAHHGRTGLTPEDRVILSPRFQRLARDAGSVAALSRDFVGELERI